MIYYYIGEDLLINIYLYRDLNYLKALNFIFLNFLNVLFKLKSYYFKTKCFLIEIGIKHKTKLYEPLLKWIAWCKGLCWLLNNVV